MSDRPEPGDVYVRDGKTPYIVQSVGHDTVSFEGPTSCMIDQLEVLGFERAWKAPS